MKLLKPLFLLILIVSLVSCNSDDDGIDPLLDSDNDGIVDIDDLCPNTPGTIIDQGCYLFTNINVSSSPYEITLLNTNETQTTNVNGLDIITDFITVGDTFQLTIDFSENGTYVIDGQYRISYMTTVAGQVTEEGTEIIDIDNETGEYSTSDSTMTFVLDEIVFTVELFNQNELRITSEDISIENGDIIVSTSEIRMVR